MSWREKTVRDPSDYGHCWPYEQVRFTEPLTADERFEYLLESALPKLTQALNYRVVSMNQPHKEVTNGIQIAVVLSFLLSIVAIGLAFFR